MGSLSYIILIDVLTRGCGQDPSLTTFLFCVFRIKAFETYPNVLLFSDFTDRDRGNVKRDMGPKKTQAGLKAAAAEASAPELTLGATAAPKRRAPADQANNSSSAVASFFFGVLVAAAVGYGVAQSALFEKENSPERDYEPKQFGHWDELKFGAGAGPSERLAHAAVAVENRFMYVHGGLHGFKDNVFSDLWRYDDHEKAWSKIETTGDVPTGRFHHSLVNVDDKAILLFGGFNVFNTDPKHDSNNELFELNLDSGIWRKLKPAGETPTKRAAHDAVYHKGSMYVFGGWSKIGATGHMRDLWRYNLATNSWTNLTPAALDDNFPPGKIGFSWVVVDDVFYLYGGGCETDSHPSESANQCSDMWSYTPATNTWKHMLPAKGEHPSPRRAAHADTAVFGIIFLFGGVHVDVTKTPPALTMMDDLHAFDPIADHWFSIVPDWGRGPKPPKTFGHTVVTLNNKVVVFGGRTGVPTSAGSNQLWRYHVIPPTKN